MIKEFQAFFTTFKQGKVVANPKAWKQGQVTAATLVALLSALATIAVGFGYDLHLNDQTIQAASSGIIALVSIGQAIATVVSTDKMGIKEGGKKK